MSPLDYREVFNNRGESYHAAVLKYPQARRGEFQSLVLEADLQPEHRICDFLAGGGYLTTYLPSQSYSVSVEASSSFHRQRVPGDALLCLSDRLAFKDAVFDRVVTLAGMHHVQNRSRVYAELARILKPGGLLCIGDVDEGSREASFLNGYVHRNVHGGHEGSFLSRKHLSELSAVGLEIKSDRMRHHVWEFLSHSDLLHFVKLLFGIPHVNGADLSGELIRRGMIIYNPLHLHWSLRFITARRPESAGQT